MKSMHSRGFVLAMCLCAASAGAEMCTLDAVPAATLLLPYFEVDLDDPQGTNTVLSVHNARAEASLAHITFWTDYSIPSLSFDIFLTGYDVVRLDLGDTFRNGNVPITADLQSDPDDTISPNAGRPQLDGSFPSCEGFFPFFNNPVITGTNLDRLQFGHTGRPLPQSGACLGSTLGDNIARGYVTIDHALRCSLDLPNEPIYFGGQNPVASNENALWGDYTIIDRSSFSMFTDNLVHIEANPDFDSSSTATGYTFYGRYTQDQGGDDHREPLGNVWGARYLNGGAFSDGTDFVVWRDSTSSITPASVVCGEAPDWYPLQEAAVSCWDEEENTVSLCQGEGDDPACFPLETQRVPVAGPVLSPPWSFGWCSLNLDIPGDSFPGDVDFPSSGGDTSQSFVAAISSATGFFEIGFSALQQGHVCDVQVPSFDSREAHHD